MSAIELNTMCMTRSFNRTIRFCPKYNRYAEEGRSHPIRAAQGSGETRLRLLEVRIRQMNRLRTAFEEDRAQNHRRTKARNGLPSTYRKSAYGLLGLL
jgi:hypothetical protein